MIGLTLSSWHGMIAEVPWVTEESRQHAYEKIRNVVRNVAYPEWILNDAALADYYKALNVTMKDDPFTVVTKVK